jgi:hypothetical protein
MRLQRALAGFISIAATLPSPPVLAGQHVLDATQLAAVLNEEVNTSNAERAAVHDALALPRVRRIASALAIDYRAIDAGVETMAGNDLEKAAGLARQITTQSVPGPSSITVSTTTIVVVLLLLILVVVTLK